MIEEHLVSGNKRIVGFLRYSVVSEKNLRAWKNTRRQTLDDACRVIFDDGRMAVRAKLFDALTLPCFKYQAEHGPAFELCVMVSPLMPKRWRETLDEAVAGLRFVKIVEVAPDEHINKVSERHAYAGLPPQVQVVTTFRIDDDDCVCNDYMTALRRASVKSNAGKVHSFHRGFYAGLDENDEFYMYERPNKSNAWGIAFIARERDGRTIFSLGGHNRVGDHAEMLLDERPNAWIRSIHDSADTFSGPSGRDPSRNWLQMDESRAITAANFSFLDLEKVRLAYAAARALGKGRAQAASSMALEAENGA